MENKTHKGKANTSGSSWVNSGRFKPTNSQADTGSIKDVDRPPSYPQIGPQSKTGFGKDTDDTGG
jgi:hypothetical protein